MHYQGSKERTLVLHGMAQTPETSPEVRELQNMGVPVVAPELSLAHDTGVLEIDMAEKKERIRDALTRDINDLVVVSHGHFPLEEIVEEDPGIVGHLRRVTMVTPPIEYPVSRYERMHKVASEALKKLGAVSMGLVGRGDKKMDIGFTKGYLVDARKIEQDARDRINRLAEVLGKFGVPRTVVVADRRDPVGFSFRDRDVIPDLAGPALLDRDKTAWFRAPGKAHELGSEYGADIAQLVANGVEYETRLQRFDPLQLEPTDQ